MASARGVSGFRPPGRRRRTAHRAQRRALRSARHVSRHEAAWRRSEGGSAPARQPGARSAAAGCRAAGCHRPGRRGRTRGTRCAGCSGLRRRDPRRRQAAVRPCWPQQRSVVPHAGAGPRRDHRQATKRARHRAAPTDRPSACSTACACSDRALAIHLAEAALQCTQSLARCPDTLPVVPCNLRRATRPLRSVSTSSGYEALGHAQPLRKSCRSRPLNCVGNAASRRPCPFRGCLPLAIRGHGARRSDD
jgi:hypothetical protein